MRGPAWLEGLVAPFQGFDVCVIGDLGRCPRLSHLAPLGRVDEDEKGGERGDPVGSRARWVMGDEIGRIGRIGGIGHGGAEMVW